jgi:YHS domain-containing protein
MVQDPVCKMILEKDEAKAKVEYNGEVLYFCSLHCKEEFIKDPEKYISKKPKRPESSGC